MNNYIFSQDPLLFQRPTQQPLDDERLRIQLEQAMQQYQNLQQPPQKPQKDYLGELDDMIKNLDENTSELLLNDTEYVTLNAAVQQIIQEELMKSVRWKINSNPDAIQKIDRLKEIIYSTSKEIEMEEKRNMIELNDYIKNYSNITFDEYKRLKAGPQKNIES